MTISQRIAQVRKDNNLSQEAFGDALGVSRQAISKWESGVSLPELEKLIAIARAYGVSIAWLLDMEERAAQLPPADANELTQVQLQLVEEIVSRYLSALPKKKPLTKKGKLLIGLGAAAGAIALLCAVASLSGRIDGITQDYSALQRDVSYLSTSVSQQLGGLTGRVEEILKSQNSLTADYGYTLQTLDPAENTVTFSVWATPKTYTAGMTATFTATADGETTQQPGMQDASHKFTAQLTCPLSDEIALTVGFEAGEQLQTQLLGQELGLDSSTRMDLSGSGVQFWGMVLTQGRLALGDTPVEVNVQPPERDDGIVRAMRVAVGIFVNDQLVQNEDLTVLNDNESLVGGQVLFPDAVLTLKPGDSLVFAATLTDNFGRKSSAIFDRFVISDENTVEMTDGPWGGAAYEVP